MEYFPRRNRRLKFAVPVLLVMFILHFRAMRNLFRSSNQKLCISITKRWIIFAIVIVAFYYVAYLQQCSRTRPDVGYFEFRSRLKGALKFDDPLTLSYLKEMYLDRPSTSPYNLSKDSEHSEGQIFGLHRNSPIIKDLFGNKKKGFFIEAGALDGEYLSNTLWLERVNNWTGLLVEPNPYSYKLLMSKNRKSYSSNTCLSTEMNAKESVIITPVADDFIYRLNAIGSSYDMGIVYKEKGIKHYLNSMLQSYSKCVCFPLMSYLLALNVSHVDFLSLDIQGTELNVLDTILFDRITVDVLLIEDINPINSTEHKEFLSRIESNNFSAYKTAGYDTFFVNNYVNNKFAAIDNVKI